MRIKDVMGCMGWAAFFLVASLWIPIFGPFFGLLTPLPFLYYSTKLGFQEGLKLTALVVLTIGLAAKLAGDIQIILIGIEFSLLGIVLSELLRRRLGFGQVILWATGFMLFLGLGLLFFTALSNNEGPFEMMLSYLKDNLSAGFKAYEETGASRDNAIDLAAFRRAAIEIVSKIYPSLMIISTGFVVWLNVVIARPLFRAGNLAYPDFSPMDRWQAPENMIWGVIVSGFALFLPSEGIELWAVNALIIMMAIYLFHGLSIVLFFLNRYDVPVWVRIGIYFIIVIQQFFLLILALAGLFDQWIDFRKIHKRIES